MTKKRDYATEILEALKEKPANALLLQKTLHIDSGRLYSCLVYLEEAGKIKWRQVSKLDGIWEINPE